MIKDSSMETFVLNRTFVKIFDKHSENSHNHH